MQTPRVPGFRYVVAAMLFLATMINYADRLMLSVVSPQVRVELGMTESDYGLMLSLFMVGYAIMYAASAPFRTAWARAGASRFSFRCGRWRPWGTRWHGASGA